jgi:DNA repair protein RadD
LKQLRPYQQDAVRECWQALVANDEPVLLMASVGAGKSLMLATILLRMEKLGKRALCLVNNAELVRNNCATFIEQGGTGSIYCAALGEKDDRAPVVFGTPKSILNGINKNDRISQIRFNIILVDEAHAINYSDHSTVFMRILRHFKQEYSDMRVLGATGTNFRFKGTEIVGDNCLFKTQVGNITTDRLIKEKYLLSPDFKIDPGLVIDFSKVKIKSNGKFDPKDLALVVSQNARLTELICKQLIHIMETQARFGVFIFATTRKHADEILSHLPATQSALILGDTPQHERTRILDAAREGRIKYLVNIAIISVGVDVPAFDTLAYLRPTESLVLLVQTLGRVLRLSPNTNKTEALVLDFAGNIERHSHWDDPILLKAVMQTLDEDKPRDIKCPACFTMNTQTARRCVGYTGNKRCDYYFEFKECSNPKCQSQNDISARHCKDCGTELIDPNKKLSMPNEAQMLREFEVIEAKYAISDSKTGFRVNSMYKCRDKKGGIAVFYENYTPISQKAKNVFYGNFIKKHCDKPSQWYLHLDVREKMQEMLQSAHTPTHLMLSYDNKGYRIKRKIFDIQQGALNDEVSNQQMACV